MLALSSIFFRNMLTVLAFRDTMMILEGVIELNVRITELRKNKKLTQEAFGEKIGVTRNFVWMLEKGDRIPSDRTVSDICREFDVNETWLRTGIGEMFIEKTRDQEISEFIGDVLTSEPDFRRRFISVLARLSPDEWELLERKIKEIASEE